MSKQDMTAKDIQNLLENRHSKDVFVPECNLGSSFANCRRMDAWAMKKSWADPVTWGYEIKVSRSDFMNDDKWREYLPYCHEFYWVCPWGLIQPNEVGEGAGLLWVTKTGSRVVRKAKAVRRELQVPEELYRYVLMSRTQIVRNMFCTDRVTKRDYWERWLADRKVDRDFGYQVGKAIGERVEQRIFEVERENAHLKRQNESYEGVRKALEKLGFNPDMPPMSFSVERRVKEVQQAVPESLLTALSSVQSSASCLEEQLNKIRGDQ